MFKLKMKTDMGKSFDRLQNNLNSISGDHKVLLGDLLTNDFISANTKFANLSEFFAAGNFEIEDVTQLESARDELDSYVKKETSFSTWHEMLSQAVADYMRARLFDGVD